MINSSIFYKITFALGVLFLVSCDTDYNGLGSSIIEDDIHHNGVTREEFNVVAYDRATGAVQTNNMQLNSLGVYNNPAFGSTVAHFVSQLELATENPTFAENPVIDTVYVYVPYYSKFKELDDEGTSQYTLDSVFGNTDAKMKLNIRRNNYFLRDVDGGAGYYTTGQKYYSDDKALIDNLASARLNNGPVSQNDEFVISAAEIQRKATIDGTEKIIERLAPGIYAQLDAAYFQTAIMGNQSKLINNNVFKEYFRGIYFNVEPIGNDGAMVTPKFSDGKIVIKYAEGPATDRKRKTMTLDMDGNTVNFFENNYNTQFTSNIASSDEANGDSRLFLKGGEGSVAFIKLDPTQFAHLKKDDVNDQPKVLVNEANLTFYIDQSMMNNAKEPMRLFIYDVKNKRPIYDYYVDATTNTSSPKYNKYVHDGIIRKQEGRGTRYRIRLTEHINNIINKDSSNITLGLVVTESINLTGSSALRNNIFESNGSTNPLATVIPQASVMHPFGTVLFGNNIPAGDPNYDKRLKLEIFYTKPN